MERDLLVQALIVVVIANTIVIGLVLLGGRTRGRTRPPSTAETATMREPAPAAPTPLAPVSLPAPAVEPAAADSGAVESPPPTSPAAGAAAASVVARPAETPPQGRADIVTVLEGPAGWRLAAELESHRIARTGRSLVVVVAELHGLPAVAERFGGSAAETLVVPLARMVGATSRRSDVIAQVAPSRFQMLLLDTDAIGGGRYLERLRTLADPWLSAGALEVRLAAGLAVAPAEGGVAEATRLAEARMQLDRRQGQRP